MVLIIIHPLVLGLVIGGHRGGTGPVAADVQEVGPVAARAAWKAGTSSLGADDGGGLEAQGTGEAGPVVGGNSVRAAGPGPSCWARSQTLPRALLLMTRKITAILVAGRGLDLHAVHHHAAVPGDHHHGPVRPGQPGADAGGNGPAHGTQVGGREVGAGRIGFPVVAAKGPVGPGVHHEDRVPGHDPAQVAEHPGRMQGDGVTVGVLRLIAAGAGGFDVLQPGPAFRVAGGQAGRAFGGRVQEGATPGRSRPPPALRCARCGR